MKERRIKKVYSYAPPLVNTEVIKPTRILTYADLTLESSWEDFENCLSDKQVKLNVSERKAENLLGARAGGTNFFGTGNDRWDKALLIVSLRAAYGEKPFAGNRGGIRNLPILLQQLRRTLLYVSGGKNAVEVRLKILEGFVSDGLNLNLSLASKLRAAYDFGWLELSREQFDLLKRLELGPKNRTVKEVKEHLPLPDEFVYQFGVRAMWILDNWLDPIADFLEYLDDKWASLGFTKNRVQNSFSPYRAGRSYLSKVRQPIIQYLEKHPNLLPKPVFDLTWKRVNKVGMDLIENYHNQINDQGHQGRLLSAEGLFFWSEESIAERYKNLDKKGGAFLAGIREQVTVVQTSLYFMLALLTGARRSELGSIPSDREPALVVEGSHGFMQARTYKLEIKVEGRDDVWILPEQLAKYLRTFQRVAKHASWFFPSRKDYGFLYLSEGGLKSPSNIGGQLKKDFDQLTKAFGIEHTLDDDGIKDHRFRKSIARLVGTCVDGGGTMLFHLFKHRAWEMTLHYINTDAMIECMNSTDAELRKAGAFLHAVHKDIEQQKSECIVDAYLDFFSSKGGKYLGGGIDRIKNMDIDFLANKTTKDKRMFLMQLSEHGTALHRPLPGVSCTKPRNQRGECNRSSVGKAIEPSECKSYCEFYIMEKSEADNLELQVAEQIQQLTGLLQSPSRPEELRRIARSLAIGIRMDVERLKGLRALPHSVGSNQLAMALINAPAGQWMEVLGL